MKRFIVIATVLAFSSMAFGQYVTDADFVSDWGDVVPYGSDPNTFSDHQVTGFDDSAAYDGTDQSGISGYNFGARTPVQRDKSIHQKYGMGINDGETGKINFEINRGGITMPSPIVYRDYPGQSTGSTSAAIMYFALESTDGATQTLYSQTWKNGGDPRNIDHPLTEQFLQMDPHDVDGDGYIHEFRVGSNGYWRTDQQAGREKIVIAENLPMGKLDIEIDFHGDTVLVADETNEWWYGDGGGNWGDDDQGRIENMQSEYHPVDVKISDRSGTVLTDVTVGAGITIWNWTGDGGHGVGIPDTGVADYFHETMGTTGGGDGYGGDYYHMTGPADATRDGVVDGLDISKLVNGFGTADAWADGDFNGDEKVDGLDISLLVNYFGADYSYLNRLSNDHSEFGYDRVLAEMSSTTADATVTAVPEPATMALLGLGGLAVLRRRRK